MKLLISMRLHLLVMLFAFCADVAVADDTACRTAPTRDCVLQMAIDRAVAQENLNRMTSGLLRIVEFQLSYDRQQSHQTFDRMMTLLEERESDPYERAQVLGRRVYGGGELFQASPTRLKVIAELELLSTQLQGEELEKTRETIWWQTRFTGDETAMRSALAFAGADVPERDVLHLLGYFAIVNNDSDGLAEIVARMPDDKGRNELFNSGAIHFADKGNVWVATSYADAIQDPNERAHTLYRIALVLSDAGLMDDVRDLMARPDFLTLNVSRRYGKPLAYLHAYLGDVDEVERHFRLHEDPWVRGLYNYNVDPDFWPIMAALISEDYQTIVTAALLIEDSRERRHIFQFVDSVYRQLGPAKMDVLFDHLTPELLIYALEGYGPYQAKTGDVSGALETLARLESMHVEPRFRSHLARSLPTALARDGQYKAALARAEEFNTSFQYLSIAREIHANTNP